MISLWIIWAHLEFVVGRARLQQRCDNSCPVEPSDAERLELVERLKSANGTGHGAWLLLRIHWCSSFW